MPNVTFYIAAEQMPSAEALAGLSRACIELCTQVLQADLNNVHVIYVEVRHGHGHPVFAEIQYRLEAFRTPQLMNQFTAALDSAILRCTGLMARIRCFAHASANIHARH